MKERIIAAKPNCIISFSCPHSIARLALDRGYHWVTTTDGPLGADPAQTFYMPPGVEAAAKDWWASTMVTGRSLSEYVLLWAMVHEYLVWHCVPSVIDAGVVRPTPDMDRIDWTGDALHAGTTGTLHHALLTDVSGDRVPLVKRYYELCGDKL